MRGRERKVEGRLEEERKRVKVKTEKRRKKEEWRGDNAKGAIGVTAASQSHISFTRAATHHIEATPDSEQTDSAGQKVTRTQVYASADSVIASATDPAINKTQPTLLSKPALMCCYPFLKHLSILAIKAAQNSLQRLGLAKKYLARCVCVCVF